MLAQPPPLDFQLRKLLADTPHFSKPAHLLSPTSHQFFLKWVLNPPANPALSRNPVHKSQARTMGSSAYI